ncbi:MAG TPA: hypothetical protein VGG73_16620 [Vicinamibacterales bacterium]|jgi:transaldolase
MTRIADFRVKIFADGADLGEMTALARRPYFRGFTANPTLMHNVVQADAAGCHITTATTDILRKLDWLGCDLDEISLDTVKMFHTDAGRAGFTLDVEARRA